ncbi:flagellar basal body rod C-terminal domain-containing protein [Blastococcus sp. TML/M2B]|nr:flagellar basal body rod C-terminal domain-containing protein [Blastococcus sp. TML/M2B]
MAGTATDKVRVVTAVGGHTVNPDGTAGGQLTALNGVFPNYQTDLDQLAGAIAAAVNGVHTDNAYDKLGNPGGDVFRSSDGGPITAATIELAFTDPALIAASGLAGGPNTDSSKADEIAQLRNKAGGPDATYRKLVVQLGVEAAVANRGLEIQRVITTQVDASRDSVAGVNLDEEMTNMLSYQHAYSAAGRLVSTIDEMLDVLINRTGRVGL